MPFTCTNIKQDKQDIILLMLIALVVNTRFSKYHDCLVGKSSLLNNLFLTNLVQCLTAVQS